MRIAVRISPGFNDVMRVMSIAGPMKNSSAGTTRSPDSPRTTMPASSATAAVPDVRGRNRDAAIGAEQAVSRF
jgi:hypothetical protein